MAQINTAVIGCGYWGPNYARTLNSLPDTNVTWCCDLDKDKLERIGRLVPGARLSDDYCALLSDDSLDAVIISTPASSHYKLTKDFLSKGKNVLVEKPLTLHEDESLLLHEIAKEQSAILMVGHIYLYNPAIQKVRAILSEGKLGDPYYFNFVRKGFGPIRSDVNAMWDLAPHDISMSMYLLNALPESVSALGSAFIQNNIDDVATLVLRFPNKITAFIHVSWLDAIKTRTMSIVGSKSMLIFDDIESLERVKLIENDVTQGQSSTPASYGEFRLLLREGDIHIPRVSTVEPLKLMCEHFIDCIRTKKQPITDGIQGWQVVRILSAAQKSLSSGGTSIPLKWKDQHL